MMGVLKTPFFDLDNTFASMQCLKWQKHMTMDGPKHLVVCGSKLGVINQFKRAGQTYTFVMGSDDDYFDIWFNFFNLQADYMAIDRKFKACMGPVALAEKYFKGLHVLDIPEWQRCLEQFFLSNLPRARAVYWMEMLCCACCGVKHKSIQGMGSVPWSPVPTIDEYLAAKSSGDLDWYLPEGCLDKLDAWVAKYFDGQWSYDLKHTDADEYMCRKWYGMDVNEFTEWFLDTEEDYKYFCLLTSTARQQRVII